MIQFSDPSTSANFQYNCEKELNKTNSAFCQFLKKNNPSLCDIYLKLIKKEDLPSSSTLIQLSIYLEGFLKNIFSLNTPPIGSIETISWVKKHFIQKQAKQKIKELLPQLQDQKIIITSLNKHLNTHLSEETLSFCVKKWMQNPEKNKPPLQAALLFSVWALATKPGKEFTKNWTLFNIPQPVDFQHLVSTENIEYNHRVGFDLTDTGPSKNYALDQSLYCLYCHERKKDSCSFGKHDNKKNILEENPLGYPLAGCPLKQKISEMNLLASKGNFIAALAVAMIDNPLLAATGHRICQDCSKACIFQKQTPVDIPAIETFLFDTVLKYAYGFEIYFLLTRWNPLNIKRPLPRKATSKKVLIAGMGPAGFTLAYHLLMEGHTVVGIDGLKIEPLSIPIHEPIKEIDNYFEPLSSRLPKGFGGVTEYGITSRWNKNYLLPIRIVLERWGKRFQLNGSSRFGSTITLQQAFENGFHHVALCIGAGKPNLPKIENVLAGGAKLASDFLMALQLSGAQREDTLLPLTIDLPCIIIGGGLTAVDAATEAQTYYCLQIKKVKRHYSRLEQNLGKKAMLSFLQKKLSEAQREQLYRWLKHASELEKELLLAQKEKRQPNTLKLLNKWGGVHLVYRKKIQKSPAYILNHPELQKALQEGINFWEELDVHKIITEKSNTIQSITFKHKNTHLINHPARSLIWATGIQSTSLKDKKISLGLKEDLPITWPKNHKDFIIHSNHLNQSLSCFGDYHPFYAGSVVKAMACAKNGYETISQQLRSCTLPKSSISPDFSAIVHKNKMIHPGCHEVIFYAPWAIKNFKPGLLYRLQSYFEKASIKENILPITEGVALSGVKVNEEKGLLHTILWTAGLSSKKLSLLKPHTPVALMGPVGCATHFEKNEKILLIAGQLGVALGKKMREANCNVVYTASFRDSFHPLAQQDFLEAGDTILACSENDLPSFLKNKDNIHCIKGLTLDALNYYLSLKKPSIPLRSFDRIITIGSTKLLTKFQKDFYTPYKTLFNPKAKWVMAVTSPMQCMMQGVCGQCLQKDINGNYTFSCSAQDQDLSTLDINFLNQRLSQNATQEVLFRSL